MPTLHLQVCAGFANRIRALVSGICAAESQNLSVVLHWFPKSPECACRFSSVVDPESLPKAVKVVPEELYLPKEVLSREDWDRLILGWDGRSDLVIKSYGIFYRNDKWETYLRALRPSPSVRELLARRCGSLDWRSVTGVHIRRTDNKKSIEGSPLESFLQRMYDTSGLLVVATDDQEVRELLVKELGTRCVFPSVALSRRTEEGMISGVTDFFALSKCPTILGSVASSFSEVAAWYGDCHLELVR